MSAIYFAIPTNAGLAKIANAIALGIPLKIAAMAVGDGGGQAVTPDPAMTTLPGEKRRAPLNTLFQDPLNAAQLVAEQIIPEDVGGWWIRCVGLYDDTGTLIAIANSPDTYKPLLTTGAGRTQVIRLVLIISDTSAVELKIDPSVVLATRKYVDDVMAAHKLSRDHPDASEAAKGFTRLATQAEVNETVPANQKDDVVVTVKKLWGWVKQASETVLGMVKIASQSETESGSVDHVVISPKKLMFGFQILTSSNGYIKFPKWARGFTIQWGSVLTSVSAAVRVTYPVAFDEYPRFVSMFPTGGTLGSPVMTGLLVNQTNTGFDANSFTVEKTRAGLTCGWIAIGFII